MSFQTTFTVRATLLVVVTLTFVCTAAAQRPDATPIPVLESAKQPKYVAGWNNLYCAGFVQTGPISTENRVIGAANEADGYNYAQNHFLYINVGANRGVNLGDVFVVVRPRGNVTSKWSRKNHLGVYVQEVGALEVVDVKSEVSVARVKTSCDTLLLGDLVQLVPQRTSPMATEQQQQFDRFSGPSGKATGRVLFARDNQEMITRDQIAFVDLGADDSVGIGDRLTIFRPLEEGNLFNMPDREAVSSRDYGFKSETYSGGRFSNQSTRRTGGREVTTAAAREGRIFLRKVVGEAVVLNVKERTATVVITRTAEEIHTGDWVEIK